MTGRIIRAHIPSGLVEILLLGRAHGAADLAVGSPSFPSVGADLVAEACAALHSTDNQYEDPRGHAGLRAAAARLHEADPDTSITVTAGAAEGLSVVLQALAQPGDEVILLEPFFELYPASVRLAGATPKFVRLRPGSWRWDPAELAAAFTARTKAVIVNSPHNPTGRVFSAAELAELAKHCETWGSVLISDEVYAEFVAEPGATTLPSALAGTACVVTLRSLSKSHAVSGWRIGWIHASPQLTQVFRNVHEVLTAGCAAPLQVAAAAVLARRPGWSDSERAQLVGKRTRMHAAAAQAGLTAELPEGGCYLFARLPDGSPSAADFTRQLVVQQRITAAPGNLFFADPADGERYLRFAYNKSAEVLDPALDRLVAGRRIGAPAARPLTIAEKIWAAHVVDRRAGEPDLLYIDLHLTHEATSPQAFDGLRAAGRRVRRPELTLAVEDHNVPTDSLVITDPVSRAQVEALRRNCAEFGIELFQMGEQRQGIVHVVGPETGLVQPGMTIACGDSHTSTHGALGALAFGIGTSEVEHVFATQTLGLRPWRTMRVSFDGELPDGVTAKDLMLSFVARIGPNGASGYVVEYAGPVVERMSVEARMTLCNMTIEAGARAGVVGPDLTTFDYIRGREYAPSGADWYAALAAWTKLRTDAGASFDREIAIDVSTLSPFVTWGTNPGQAVPLHGAVPDPEDFPDLTARAAAIRALQYMDLVPGALLRDLPINAVFVGSCTNGRIEDLRAVAQVLAGRRVAPSVNMLIVPGSMQVRTQAEAEGLAQIFEKAGAQWRNAGCSMCLGMNPDRLTAGARCVATSNRNFEGRQGAGVRTHLASPEVAAASAVAGRIAGPGDLD